MTNPLCILIGAGPGNGAAFARRFASSGHQVALLARTSSFLETLAAESPAFHGFTCDARDPALLTNVLDQIRSSLGPASVLIYNAGEGEWKPPEETTLSGFESSWRTNALGLLVSSQHVTTDMLATESGNIVVIGATASLRGGAGSTAFAAAKAAQRSVAQSLARRLGPRGIHVSHVIIDGVIDLQRTRAKRPEASDDFYLQPDDIAETVEQLTRQARSAWTFEIDLRPHSETW
jgi:NAD(P)-dependent dehydrogenase (short-subunit alcohol dehydrogenase family)